jgi:hypothetical protein
LRKSFFDQLRATLEDATGTEFRVVWVARQERKIHLLAEARDNDALSFAMRSITIGFARTWNGMAGRKGPVWGDRYALAVARTPTELAKVLVLARGADETYRLASPRSALLKKALM